MYSYIELLRLPSNQYLRGNENTVVFVVLENSAVACRRSSRLNSNVVETNTWGTTHRNNVCRIKVPDRIYSAIARFDTHDMISGGVAAATAGAIFYGNSVLGLIIFFWLSPRWVTLQRDWRSMEQFIDRSVTNTRLSAKDAEIAARLTNQTIAFMHVVLMHICLDVYIFARRCLLKDTDKIAIAPVVNVSRDDNWHYESARSRKCRPSSLCWSRKRYREERFKTKLK